MVKPNIHVSIAILVHQNQILVGWREAHQHQGNKYEFPGGKVEQGETRYDACYREVAEEVGIQLKSLIALDSIAHEYDDIIVNLHFFLSYIDAQDAQCIQAPWRWYRREELLDLNFPKANQSMIKRLTWRQYIKISDDLNDLNQLAEGQYFYWRPQADVAYAQALAAYAPEQLASLIVNIEVWKKLSELQQQMVAAVQLKHHQLMQFKLGDLHAKTAYIASCHDQQSLSHAQQIGCEAAFLSPVQATLSHPQANTIGWTQFAQWVQQADLAVYALGGLKQDDLAIALQHGAHGIAGIRNF